MQQLDETIYKYTRHYCDKRWIDKQKVKLIYLIFSEKIGMKFKFCGGQDCPDWLLAEIAAMSSISAIKVKQISVKVSHARRQYHIRQIVFARQIFEYLHTLTQD